MAEAALVESTEPMEKIGVGIVGAGDRGIYCMGESIVALTRETGLTVRGIFDIIPERSYEAKEHLENLYAEESIDQKVRVYGEFEAILADPGCHMVLVTNHTNQHRSHAVAALEAGKKVYLDKPISVTREDADRIVEAARKNPLIMGFTRRYEKSWVTTKRLLESGAIGTLQMMEITSIIPYHRYLQTWHRKRAQSGGAINDKNSHHFDVFNWMAGEYPEYLTAVGGRSSVFPVEENAPESCRVCSRECPYRRDPNSATTAGGSLLRLDSWRNAEEEVEKIDTCVYAPGADISDHALVTVVYPSGVKASLFFAIFGPDTKDQETMILVGEKGKITLNRHEGLVTLVSEYGNKEEVFDCRGDDFATSHFGADRELARALRAFYDGDTPVASAVDGLVSLDMVLATQESIQRSGQPVRIGARAESTV